MNQFQFLKKKKNTKKNQLTENIKNGPDNNRYNCGIFLDFQKTFDTVNHRILVSKFECYRTRVIPHDLIRSYLTDRKHYPHINEVALNTLTSTYGLP